MTQWIVQLLKARQSQEDVAVQRLAYARHAHTRAQRAVLAHSERIDALGRNLEADATPHAAGAFVAAAVAVQAAAATYADACGIADRAEDWVRERQGEMTQAARDRHVAEELKEHSDALALQEQLRREQRAADETAATGHERRRRDEARRAR